MELFYYEKEGRRFVSHLPGLPLPAAPQPQPGAPLTWLLRRPPQEGPTVFCPSSPRQLFAPTEDTAFLDPGRLPECPALPPELLERIRGQTLPAANILHPRWELALRRPPTGRVRVHLLAVGDVGGILLIALKLLGGDCIQSIGICDLNPAAVARWTAELGQVSRPWDYDALPDVAPIQPQQLFDCDVFLFAASRSVPPVGSGVRDVRMAQYDANRAIVEEYARRARAADFRGLFCVMSDPVDPLCAAACRASNLGPDGVWDGKGLLAEQVRGLGLGVMNARAAALARQNPRYGRFLKEGRSFGPHGAGLVIADSLTHYDDAASRELTQEVLAANLRIRELGFKPYVAPALSSGALQLLLLLRGQWHCASGPLGSIWFGCRSRLSPAGLVWEANSLPDALFARLRETEALLKSIH